MTTQRIKSQNEKSTKHLTP